MRTFLILSFLLFLSNWSYAGTTGKIAGKISDSETSEPLAGVNILIDGTLLGAASDMDGYFSILNVQPGSYSLTISYVGYAEHRIKNLRVNIGLTTIVEAELKLGLLTSDVVEVIAHRPVVERGVSNSQLNMEAKTIEALPISTVSEALVLQAGIEQGSTGLIIRGGGANQTVFMVDGLSNNDERSNYPYTGVSLGNIEDVQVQTGGFNAEYEQARSGIVNVITKEGKTASYSGFFSYQYQPAAPKHFGLSVYDEDSYFNRPYYDPDVMWTGTDNGAWDEYTQTEYPKFQGWNAVADATLQDDDPTNDLTPEAALRLFQYYRRRDGEIKKPDYLMDFGFGGPLPFISKYTGNGRFYATHQRSKEMFVFPLSVDGYAQNHTQLKLTSDIATGMKLMLSGQYGEESSVSSYNWTPPTGSIIKSTSQVALLPSSSSTGMSIPFMEGFFSPTKIYHKVINLKFTHTLNAKSLYEAKLQYKHNNYHTFQTEARDTSKVYEPVPGIFVDEAPYGYWPSSVSGPANMHLGGWMNLGRDNSEIATTSFYLSYTNQFNKQNLFKAGVSFIYNDYNIKAFTEHSGMNTWRRSSVYHVYPFRIGLYLQDKLEFEGFIANAGLRVDYSDANTAKLDLSKYDTFYSSSFGSDIETLAPTKDSTPSLTFSPRLGISHPISENAKFYFNYGHYRSEPFSSYRFRIQREDNGTVTYIGDPNMGQEKTVSYEAGYEHNLMDQFLIKIAGYYKDISEQPGWIYYDALKDVSYYQGANNNYADVRGLELTLTKRIGKWVTGFINYTYDVRSSGYFGVLEYHQDPREQKEYLLKNPAMTRVHPRPYARINIDFHTPDDYGPMYFNMYPIGGLKLNLLSDWKTGRYYTFNPNEIAGIADNTQWRDWWNTDLRISKKVDVSKIGFRLFLDVKNVFNYKYMSSAGFSDNYDWQDYLYSLNFSWENGDEHGNDRIGDYRPDDVAYDPLEPNPGNDSEISARNDQRKKDKSYIDMPNIRSLTFLNPRSFRFGVTINF